MNIQQMNIQQHLINSIVDNGFKSYLDTPLNLKQFIMTAAVVGYPRNDENAEKFDEKLIKRSKLVDLFFESVLDEDPAEYEVPANQLQAHFTMYNQWCEDWLCDLVTK